MMSLTGKHIVVGVTGGIAAYKTASLVRLLKKEGAEVIVLMTPASKEFVSPLTMATLSQNPVASEFFDRRDGSWHSHVELGIWADLMIVAPATACSLAKMATGVADNLLITTYLSMKAPILVAPAMDLDMYAHDATQENIRILQRRGVAVIDADEGFLASGLEGKGRMAEPEKILAKVCSLLSLNLSDSTPKDFAKSLRGKKVLITAGPTHEAIDPVRYIGNYSTGKMGIALAKVAHDLGAEVHLVLGPSEEKVPEGIKVCRVISAVEMLSQTSDLFSSSDLVIFAAAVADYRPEEVFSQKIKRSEKEEKLSLRLLKNPDIAQTLSSQKKETQTTIGFALESSFNLLEAKRKMETKNLDFIVLNSLSDPGAGFGTNTNKVTILSCRGDLQEFPLKSKEEVAYDIFYYVMEALYETIK